LTKGQLPGKKAGNDKIKSMLQIFFNIRKIFISVIVNKNLKILP